MSLTITQGFPASGGRILPTSNLDWQDLGSSPYATWSNWTSWNPSPNNVEFTYFYDAGSVDFRTPTMSLFFEGDITVSIEMGLSVDSNLDIISPTTINLALNTPQTPVAARYYLFTVTVAADSNTLVPYVIFNEVGFTDSVLEETQKSVDTSTLTGTIDARVISTNIGLCSSIVVTPRQEGVTYSSGLLQDRFYARPDDYVFQENAIIVNTVSLSPPTIRCFDLNGESIDAIVDIRLEGVAKMQLISEGVIALGI